jgi:signal transduction histidine kinase
MSIRTRLWLLVTALLAVVLLGNAIVVVGMETRELRSSLERESLTFARLAGPQALRAYGESGREVNEKLMSQLGEIAAGMPALRSFGLFTARGRMTLAVYPMGAALTPVEEDASISPEGVGRYVEVGTEKFFELVVPAYTINGDPAVYIKVLVSEGPVQKRLSSLKRAYGASLAVLLLLGAALAAGLARAILGPVDKLKIAAAKIRDGDLGVRVGHTGSGELAELADTFDSMAQELEQHRHILEHRNEALERAYAELQALQDELAKVERMAAVGRTAAAISHEIDNPIGVILGTAETLRRELGAEPERVEDLLLIESECKRCRRIVRDLLALARPAAHESGPVDLAVVLQPVIRGLAHHPAFRGIEVDTEWHEEMPKAVADLDAVKQILLNLLLNAARVMKPGGRIVVAGGFDEQWVRVRVIDQGPGIPSGEEERIFEPFYTTTDGNGLGLAVSRRIIEQEGGRITAENRHADEDSQGGSVFTVEWPRQG